MGHIKKIKRKKGTVYKAEVRRTGHQYTSKTFKKLSEAREWAKRTEKKLKLLSSSDSCFSSDDQVAALANEIKQLKEEILQIKNNLHLNNV